MRAVVLREFGGPEVLQFENVPVPTVGPDEVRIKVRATALNRADLAEREGHYPPPGKPPEYQIPGLECSGVVEAVGERVMDYAIGDEVMALLPGGGYAELVVVSERLVMPRPLPISVVQAAAIPEVFLTAFDALYFRGGARPGGRVLVHAGASGVGSAAIQLAHQVGIQVATTVGSQMKLEAVRAFGADLAINYRSEDFLQVVRDWSAGVGVDVVLDFIGKDYLADNLKALADDGTLVLIGALSGYQASINLGIVQARRLKIHGTALRSRPIENKMALVRAFTKEALPMMDSGRVKPVIDRTFSFAEIADAHRYMESNQNIGKIVIEVSGR